MSTDYASMEKLRKYITENDVKNVVVASQGGKTVIKLAGELGKDTNIIAVSEFAYSDKAKKDMKKQKITTVEEANLPIQDIREMRETLMMFDSGIKAALEVASIAASKKLSDGKMVAIAGGGLNTILVVDTVHPDAESIAEPLKQLKVKKILVSPLV